MLSTGHLELVTSEDYSSVSLVHSFCFSSHKRFKLDLKLSLFFFKSAEGLTAPLNQQSRQAQGMVGGGGRGVVGVNSAGLVTPPSTFLPYSLFNLLSLCQF